MKKTLERRKNGKEGGPDNKPVELWKWFGEVAVEFLDALLNKIW